MSTEFLFEAARKTLAMIIAQVPHNEGDFLRFYPDLEMLQKIAVEYDENYLFEWIDGETG